MNLPNQLSLLRILLTPLFVFLLFLDGFTFKLLSFAVFTVASLTDFYDGHVARKYGNVSVTGQFLDPLADKILISSAFICFNLLGYVPVWMVLVIVIRDFLLTGLRSYAIAQNRPIRTIFLAKAKTFSQIVMAYFIFIFHLAVNARLTGPYRVLIQWVEENRLIYSLMFMVTILTALSGVVYLVVNRDHLIRLGRSLYRIFVPSDAGGYRP
jgi:CDP-diacylglycerol--glycerol-3-phosphate 3-phosphatidyltransferase